MFGFDSSLNDRVIARNMCLTDQYSFRYRQEGAPQWIPVDVEPQGSTKAVIHNLQPGTIYEFQVIGKNVLGDGMFSNIVKETTKGLHFSFIRRLNSKMTS